MVLSTNHNAKVNHSRLLTFLHLEKEYWISLTWSKRFLSNEQWAMFLLPKFSICEMGIIPFTYFIEFVWRLCRSCILIYDCKTWYQCQTLQFWFSVALNLLCNSLENVFSYQHRLHFLISCTHTFRHVF